MTGNTVNIVSTPNSTTERLALYQQLLAAEAADIDVFQIDVIRPGILGTHFIDLAGYSDSTEGAHFDAIAENNTIDGAREAGMDHMWGFAGQCRVHAQLALCLVAGQL